MMGTKVQQEIPTGTTVQVSQTKIPSGKEPLNPHISVAKPLGFPTKQDVGCFNEDKGLGLSHPFLMPTLPLALPGATWASPGTNLRQNPNFSALLLKPRGKEEFCSSHLNSLVMAGAHLLSGCESILGPQRNFPWNPREDLGLDYLALKAAGGTGSRYCYFWRQELSILLFLEGF